MSKKHDVFVFNQVIMLLLSIISVVLLAYELYSGINLARYPVYNKIDFVICAVFLLDFLYHRAKSHHKKGFVGRHWVELLAAIPLTGYPGSTLLSLNLFYGFSALHILRLLRLFIRIKILLNASDKFAKHSYLVYVFTTVAFIVIGGAAGFYFFENGVNQNLHNFNDAIWWAIVTVTSVGYGDIYPVTVQGKLVAVVVMITGLATLGTLLALIESIIIRRK